MGANEVSQMIGQVGFPIAAFLLMFWQNTTIIKANTQAMQDLKEVIGIKK